jgi:hypothetical protein
MNKIIYGSAAALVGLILVFSYMFIHSKKSFITNSDKLVKELDGKSVAISYNQVWPFDFTQSMVVSVVGKKYVDDFQVLVVDIKASAKVSEAKEEKVLPKEHTATNPNKPTTQPKESVTNSKLPSRIYLNGLAKLTYEYIDGEWYLINVDNISLKATPVD